MASDKRLYQPLHKWIFWPCALYA